MSRSAPSPSRSGFVNALKFVLFSASWCMTHSLAVVTRKPKTSPWRSNCIRMSVTSFDTDVKSNEYNVEAPEGNSKIRPLHQNWWPVTLINALQKDRPNAIMALGMRLVIFHDGTSWTCLDDQCAHRFAPLSEGRVIPADASEDTSTKHIQCAYHGWEFDGCGACKCIPQATSSKDPAVLSKSFVPRYPVRAECGILWVWTDLTTSESIAPTIKLPLSPVMKAYHAKFGDASGFMRDLPYGMELLGENLADVSHLPFSHHAVGSLRRDLASPLPFRMMSEAEKLHSAKRELRTLNQDELPENLVLPRFQVELLDAPQHDPMIKSQNPTSNGTLQIGFFEPCHFRHQRTGLKSGDFSVELFLCPIDSARSRVIVWNAFKFLVSGNVTSSQTAVPKRIWQSPKAWLKAFRTERLHKRLNPASIRSHMISHVIFDGDGIFLHKQGERMRRLGTTFRDYDQPLAADILVSAFRRYLDVAAKKSLETGHLVAAASVSGTNYDDNQPRGALLDRYESHTKYCVVCQKGLEECRKKQALWNVAGIALTGAAGASSTVFMTALVFHALLGPAVALPWTILQVLGSSTVLTTAGSVMADRKKRQAEKDAEQFLFTDYVHADKD